MKTPKPDQPGPADAFGSEVSRRDWDRYGAGHPPAASPPAVDALGHPVPLSPRDDLDEMYLEYRRESGVPRETADGARRSRRSTANVAVVTIVGIVAVIAVVATLATSSATPPAPTRSHEVASAPASVGPSGSPLAARTPISAHVGTIIDLPMTIAIPDRDQLPDDGVTVYLTGPVGGFSMDPGTGAVKTIYGGAAFSGGVRRAVVFGGLWVSSWPADVAACAVACWRDATTYRINPDTGDVTMTLTGTYLIGASSDGVWVGTGQEVRRLDPGTGAVLGTTPWKRSNQARLGCGSLWSFTPAAPTIKTAKLEQIAPETGQAIASIDLDATLGYGPTYVEGQCWMMTGSGGASANSTTLAWIGANGQLLSVLQYPKSIVTLDGEFWTYSNQGLMQRFEATSGVGYGTLYKLPVRPPNDDPKWLFAATGTLWMVDGRQLAGFDLMTGATGQRG